MTNGNDKDKVDLEQVDALMDRVVPLLMVEPDLRVLNEFMRRLIAGYVEHFEPDRPLDACRDLLDAAREEIEDRLLAHRLKELFGEKTPDSGSWADC